MIILIKYLLTLSLFITGCSTYNKNIVSEECLSNIWIVIQKQLQKGNYKTAIELLKTLNDYHPFSHYAQQAKLDMIYAYYKLSELPLVIETINNFININPTHPNIDYVLYMRGLAAQLLDNNINNTLLHFFNIDCSDHDPQYALMAFRDFKRLIHLYPNSLYATDASKRLIFLKERLAKHELAIIKHYIKHNAYIAVINRTEQMLKKYPDTKSIRNALKYMETAYDKLGLIQEKNKVTKLITANNIQKYDNN